MMSLIGGSAGGWIGFGIGALLSTWAGLSMGLIGAGAGIWIAARMTEA